MIDQELDTIGDQHTTSNESQDPLPGKDQLETGFPHEQPQQQPQQLPAPELQVTTKPRKIGLSKYTIYVTNQRMYIVGSNLRETVFRILEIDLTSYDKLIIMEDNVYFTRNEIMDVLNGLEETSEGGLTKKITAVGLLGFIKFTKYYYLLVVIKRRPIAVLGGYEIYHIDETELIPVTNNPKKADRNSEEARYVQTFLNIDLNKTFYYSYSYDITNSLQTNMVRNKLESLGINDNLEMNKVSQFNRRFVWNSALLKPVFQSSFDRVYDWFQPIIHGFIDQVKISIFDVQVYVTLIARRSHHFAGARFFKRGVNDVGDVANEVETEQIVCDLLTSSFHDPAAGFYNNPRYTSFVQHRGSIPLSWSQATAPNIRMTKPPIEIDVVDPFYSKSAIHFDDLFQRYGTPIQVLNLIKQREKTPRETKLLDAFQECINYLNQFLPKDKNIQYTAWDMSRASKSRGQDVIEWLENYSEQTLQTTGFFRNGKTILDTKLQQGICRTNCVDCLDRTNTAQFVIGKRALGHQLYALGLIEEKYLEYDSDVTNILTEMFHDHGDTIALQYGGSHLVNTLQTYRKINQWTSHSRDIIESVKRFYSNSFMDAQRQEAINLFLGNYVYEKGIPMLWELNTDYYLHNKESNTNISGKISYTHWYSDKNLTNEKKNLDGLYLKLNKDNFFSNLQKKGLFIIKVEPYTGCFENYWNEKYSSRDLISFNELFEFNMNSTMQYGINFEQKINSGIINEVSPNAFNFPFKLTGKNEIKNNKEANDNDTESNYSLRTGISTNIGLSNNLNESSEKYFSPFKSRKPHRELKFQYVYKGKIEKEKENKAYSEFKEFGENDEKRFTEFENENEKEEALKFSILQLKNFKTIQKRMNNILMITKKKIVKEEKQTINSLPIIDIENIGILNDEYEVNDFNKTVIDIKEDTKGDVDEDTEIIYNSMKDNYGSGLPSVNNYEINFYNESVNIEHKLKVVNHDSIYLNENVNEMVNEYSNIISPAISNKDLELYRRMTKGIEEIEVNADNGGADIILPKFHRHRNNHGIKDVIGTNDIPNCTIITHPDDYFSFSQLNTGLRRSLSMYSVGGLQNVENPTSPNNLTN